MTKLLIIKHILDNSISKKIIREAQILKGEDFMKKMTMLIFAATTLLLTQVASAEGLYHSAVSDRFIQYLNQMDSQMNVWASTKWNSKAEAAKALYDIETGILKGFWVGPDGYGGAVPWPTAGQAYLLGGGSFGDAYHGEVLHPTSAAEAIEPKTVLYLWQMVYSNAFSAGNSDVNCFTLAQWKELGVHSKMLEDYFASHPNVKMIPMIWTPKMDYPIPMQGFVKALRKLHVPEKYLEDVAQQKRLPDPLPPM